MNHDFDDRVVVVTGAAVGIGKATAVAFGNAGGTVYLVDVDADAGSASAGAITGATFIQCDLTLEGEVAAAVEAIDQTSGRIDVLVNNAGGFPEALGLEDTSIEEWHRILDSNLTSVFLMTRAALPLLRRSEAGRIVNLGSLAGQTAGWQTAPPYVAAKAGVRRRFAPHQLRHAHAVELAHEGVPLNVIQRQLGHTNLGVTSIYLQGIDNAEIIATVHARKAPMIPASTGLRL